MVKGKSMPNYLACHLVYGDSGIDKSRIDVHRPRILVSVGRPKIHVLLG